MKLLTVKSGLFGDHSNSNALVNTALESFKELRGELTITSRDVTSDPLPYFDARVAIALNTPPDQRDEDQKAVVALSDDLIQELKDADAIMIGVPMYNFAVPAQLKTWFDYLARAGVTFQYTETGPVGLLEDRPVYVLAARGGIHLGTPSDSQTQFLKSMFGLFGLNDVRICYAEGLAIGDEFKKQSMDKFKQDFLELA